jgi:heme o synthase
VTGLVGELVLLLMVNSVTAVLGGLTLLFYLGIYTPSKKVSSMSTLIGAIPGAMPPLMGWTSSYGFIAPEGLLLFSILFIWQIPHFLAIAWIYREDYARGGFPILSVVDEDGRYVAKQVVLYSIVLLPLTLVPTIWDISGEQYFVGALFLGLCFIGLGIRLALNRVYENARLLFLYSVIYLPILSVLMVWDRTF